MKEISLYPIRDFGLRHLLYAIWLDNECIGQIEMRDIPNKVTAIYALGINSNMRGKGYGRLVIEQCVKNPRAEIYNIERSALGFWQKVMPESPSIVKLTKAEAN